MSLLTPREAEELVQNRIEDFGSGALPEISVKLRSDGSWLVRWEGRQASCEPMTLPEWKAWLERHVGSVEPSRLQQTEG